ncbi:PilN domain-containing protein [Chloroflexota bacterium]
MAVNTITLDIDGESMKLLEIAGRRVGKWASAPIDQSLVERGLFSSPELLGSQVKNLMNSSGIRGKGVITSLSGLFLISRILTVPRMKKGLDWETIQEAVLDVMPAEGLAASWQILDKKENYYRILVVWVPSDVSGATMRAMRAGGLTPKAIELRSIALARAVNKGQALIFNVDRLGYDFVIVDDGIPQVMLTNQIPDGFTTDDIVDAMARTMEQATSFYNSQNPEAPLATDTPLVLVGQLVEDPILKEKIQDLTSHPIEAFDPPLQLPPHLPASRYAVNIGLAIKAIQSSRASIANIKKLDIDLRYATKKREPMSLRRILPYAAVIFAIVLVFLLYNVTANAINDTEELKYELADYQMQVDLRRAQLNEVAVYREEVEQYNVIVRDSGYKITMLNLLEGTAPSGVQIKSIRITTNDFTISGTANTDDQLAYKIALEATGEFSKISLPTASSVGGNFTITIKK